MYMYYSNNIIFLSLTFEAVVSVLVVLLLLEAVGLEQGVRWMLEARDRVSSR